MSGKKRFDVRGFIDKIAQETAKNYNHLQGEQGFQQFLNYAFDNPQIALRTSYGFMFDAINHLGVIEEKDCGEVVTRYELFKDPFDNGNHAIFGTRRALENLVNEIRSSAMEEGNERIVLLHGPVATAKTSVIDLIGESMRNYSRTDEGALFRFYWHFTPEHFSEIKKKRPIGFGRQDESLDDKCCGGCDDHPSGCDDGGCGEGGCGDGGCGSSNDSLVKEISVPCQINENPIYLITDKKQREVLLNAIAEEYKERTGQDFQIPKKILEGNLCYNCHQIYDHLLKKYEGDLDKVLEHIKVERFLMDSDRGLVDVVAGGGQDTHQKVRIYANDLAKLFPQIDFISMYGQFAAANRGMIHFSEIFNIQSGHTMLLDAAEKHRVTMNGVRVNIDEAMLATTNLEQYSDVEKAKYTGGLMDRTKKIDFPYILNFKEEMKIYERDLAKLKRKKHIAPHTVEVAAMWAVITRYSDPFIREPTKLRPEQIKLLHMIDPLEKLEIYSGKANYEFDYIDDDKKALIDDQFRKELRNASNIFVDAGQEIMAEGLFGVSPRRIQDVFKRILEGDKCLNPLKVLDLIEKLFREERGFFKHLNLEDQMREFAREKLGEPFEYYKSETQLGLIRKVYQKAIGREVRYCILDTEESELEEKIKKYVKNVRIDSMKRGNLHPENEDEFEPEILEYVEGLIAIDPIDDDEIKEFRKQIGVSISEYRDRNPDVGKEIDLRKALPGLFRGIEEALFEKKKEKMNLTLIEDGLRLLGTPAYDTFDEPETKEDIDRILGKMKERHDYCDECARDITLYIIQEDLLDPFAFFDD